MSRRSTKQPRPADDLSRENLTPPIEQAEPELAAVCRPPAATTFDGDADLAAEFGALANGAPGELVPPSPPARCSCAPGANDCGELCAVCAAIKPENRCPICWGTNRGVGWAYTTKGTVRYMKCDHSLLAGGGRCRWTWTVTIAREIIRTPRALVTYRDVETEQRE